MSNEIEDFPSALTHMGKALEVWPKNLNLIYDSCRAEVANDESKRLKGNLTPGTSRLEAQILPNHIMTLIEAKNTPAGLQRAL